MLGYYYSYGIGTNVNNQKAFELYQKAANLGNSIAQCKIASIYKDGKGTIKNVEQAIY